MFDPGNATLQFAVAAVAVPAAQMRVGVWYKLQRVAHCKHQPDHRFHHELCKLCLWGSALLCVSFFSCFHRKRRELFSSTIGAVS